MLTPAKIKNHHFEASGRNAYRADSVDAFFEEVAASYEQMFRENGEMYKKISLLAERLEEYRNDEDNIRNALLTAQRMSEQIQREAREKADTMVADAQARAVAENARTDAEINEKMTNAAYQAQALVEEAKKQAEKIVYDATHESKEAAISARDWMIKEEAALEMMKIEVTKFKKQILDSYAQQLELIETLPEVVYAQLDAQKEEPVEEAPEEPVAEEPVVEEPVVEEVVEEEPVAQVEEPAYAPESVFTEEPVYLPEEAVQEAVFAPTVPEYAQPVYAEPAYAEREAESVNVDTLQQMIEETEDTDAEDERYDYAAEEPVAVEAEEESEGEFILPSVEDDSNTDLNEIVGYFSESNKSSGDVMFTKPRNEERPNGGFNLNMDKISSYGAAPEIEEADMDEFDEDINGGNNGGDDLASKFKSFFKK